MNALLAMTGAITAAVSIMRILSLFEPQKEKSNKR